jgi:S1-C subfamily serine protease
MATQLQDLSATLSGLVAATARSVVSVHSKGARSAGFVWKPGLIVTADDALADEGEVQVTPHGGAATSAQIVGRDPTTGVGLLRIDRTDLPPVTFAAAPAAGALAVVVGMEDGAATAALGVVSLSGPAWRSLRGGEIDARLELGARLRRRGEGAVVVDASGQAFGMAVLAPRRRTLVIPGATIDRVAARLEAHGRIPRGYLGLGLHPVALEAGGGTGAMVVSVDPKGPGAAAGIHQGDVLVSWDGKPVGGVRPLLRALGPDSVGRKVALEIRRAGQTQQATLTVGERPAD